MTAALGGPPTRRVNRWSAGTSIGWYSEWQGVWETTAALGGPPTRKGDVIRPANGPAERLIKQDIVAGSKVLPDNEAVAEKHVIASFF